MKEMTRAFWRGFKDGYSEAANDWRMWIIVILAEVYAIAHFILKVM